MEKEQKFGFIEIKDNENCIISCVLKEIELENLWEKLKIKSYCCIKNGKIIISRRNTVNNNNIYSIYINAAASIISIPTPK